MAYVLNTPRQMLYHKLHKNYMNFIKRSIFGVINSYDIIEIQIDNSTGNSIGNSISNSFSNSMVKINCISFVCLALFYYKRVLCTVSYLIKINKVRP